MAAILTHQEWHLVVKPCHGLLVAQHKLAVMLYFMRPVDEIVIGVHILNQVAVFMQRVPVVARVVSMLLAISLVLV